MAYMAGVLVRRMLLNMTKWQKKALARDWIMEALSLNMEWLEKEKTKKESYHGKNHRN